MWEQRGEGSSDRRPFKREGMTSGRLPIFIHETCDG